MAGFPQIPNGWLDGPDTKPSSPDGMPLVHSDSPQDGILGGLSMPEEWSLANSGIHMVMPVDALEKVDFSGMAQPELAPVGHVTNSPSSPLQPDNGFYTGLTPYHSDPRWGNHVDRDEASMPPLTSRSRTDQWVQLPQPAELEAGESGSGYYTYGTDKSGKPGTTTNAQWGQPKTMQVIGAVADRLATGGRYTPFGVGNISLQNGADFSGKYGHKDHNDGLTIDLRPARADGAPLPVAYQSGQYDRDATQRLVDAFHSTGQVSNIYFNDPRISGVQPLAGHDNHLHVKLKP